MSECVQCQLKDCDILKLKEGLIRRARKIDSLQCELVDIKTAIRILMKAVQDA